MSESAESNRDGLNALGNPDREIRTGVDRGPSDERVIGNVRPGGILARSTPRAELRKGMRGVMAGESRLRKIR